MGKEHELLGLVHLNDIRDKMFIHELLDSTFVIDYYMHPQAVTDYYDSFERIMKVFDDTQAWNLPVIKDGKFAGILSRSKLYSEYKKLMVQLSDD